MKNNKDDNTFLNFIEKPSKRHKQDVFKAVKGELLFNKKSSTKNANSYWLSGALSSLFALVVYFQFINPVQNSTDLDTALSDNLLMELSSLSPDEVEIVDDLELMDALDSLSPEELKEIM